MSDLITEDLIPMAGGYLLTMGILGAGYRIVLRERRAAEATRVHRLLPSHGRFAVVRGWLAFVGEVLGTALGGYALQLGVVALYYVGLLRHGGEAPLAVSTGAAALLGVALPMFFAASSWDIRRHRQDSNHDDDRTTGRSAGN